MIELKSFAKVNLGLEIVGKRPDGYHNLKTIFQTIDLYDTLEIKENSSGILHLDGDRQGDFHGIAWDKSNTISKAVEMIYNTYNLRQGFDIVVKKRIPPGSGLGGGSSNAAVVLLFLVEYFQLTISPEELIGAAAKIGADVPFFLVGGTVFAEGIGEIMTPLADPGERRLDIVIPPVNVSTGLIFSSYNLTSKPITSKIDTFTNSKNLKILENNLEKTTFELFPEVKMIKEKMQTMGYELVLMSGSGSAVVGVHGETHEHRTNRSDLCTHFPGMQVFTTKTLNRQHYLERIGASPSGKASVFGADTRRFESSRPSDR